MNNDIAGGLNEPKQGMFNELQTLTERYKRKISMMVQQVHYIITKG